MRLAAVARSLSRSRLHAAGTGAGDLVVLSYENGALREVARTLTELWLPTVKAGSFRTPGVSDMPATTTATSQCRPRAACG